MKHPVLPLVVQSELEPLKSWEGISTPSDLARYMARVLSVDPNQLLQFEEIVFSDVQPTGDEASKIWFKTDEPIGIGIPSGDNDYNILYQYSPNVAYLWLNGSDRLPSYFRKITQSELEDYSLTDPTEKKAFWVVFEK